MHVPGLKRGVHEHYTTVEKTRPIQEVPAHCGARAEALVHFLPKWQGCYGNTRSVREKRKRSDAGRREEHKAHFTIVPALLLPPSQSHHSAAQANTMTPAQPLTAPCTHTHTHFYLRSPLWSPDHSSTVNTPSFSHWKWKSIS